MTAPIEKSIWKSAASHFLGAGLEAGCLNLGLANSVKQRLTKQGMYKEAKALDCIVCGGVWTEAGADAAPPQTGSGHIHDATATRMALPRSMPSRRKRKQSVRKP